MKREDNLFGKICDIDNIEEAHRKARRDKKFYYDVKMVDKAPRLYAGQIKEMLEGGTYEVSPYSISTMKERGKERVLAKLPYYPDRIIQWAIMLQVEPTIMSTFCTHSCASIKDRGISRAVYLTKKYLKDVEGTRYCLQTDVHHFYQTIDREILKKIIRKKFKDPQLLGLLDKIIDSGPGDVGIPIGSYLSQYLANLYLTYFDHYMKEVLHLKYVVRYMDDIIVLAKRKSQLHAVRKLMAEYLGIQLHLELKSNYQVFPVDDRGIDFVGFRFFHGYTLLRKTTCTRFKKAMVKIRKKQDRGQILNCREYSCANSYSGWLKMCNAHRLGEKYLEPVRPALDRYYKTNIKKEVVTV